VSDQNVFCFVVTRLLQPRVRQHVVWYMTEMRTVTRAMKTFFFFFFFCKMCDICLLCARSAIHISDTDVIVCKQQSHQRPLTRYLPIRSESLNLRQHIESAGHQIELCVHVSLDSTSCRGYLHKMGSKFHHWNRRWFVFDRLRRTLTYYSDRGEKKPRGGVYFQVKSLINSYYKFRY